LFTRRNLLSLGTACLLAIVAHAQSSVQSELRFQARSGADKNAGVWIDGQYVGYVKELNGAKKILLLPGKHEIVVRQAWYKDYLDHTVLEPGEIHVITVALEKQAQPVASAATAELKIVATPTRAAVFVDDQFAGHVDEFSGGGRAMLLTPGPHRLRIALPGYQPFETSMTLRDHQKAKIETELLRGSIADAGAMVTTNN
jgi:hypothetical protein